MADWMTWEGEVPGIGGGALTADIVKQITASSEAEVTNHPVEEGFEISDHVIKRPKRVTFEFAQSAIPFAQESETNWEKIPLNVRDSEFRPFGLLAITMLAGAAIAAVGKALGLGSAFEVWALTSKENKDRIHELHDKLIEVLDNSYMCTFSYQGLYLPNYVLTGVQYSRGVPGGIARFTIEAQAVITVSTSAALIAGGVGGLPKLPAAINLVPAIPMGPGATEKIEKEVVQKSMLASGLDALL